MGRWSSLKATLPVSLLLRRSRINKSMSINPQAMYAGANMQKAITFGASALTSTQEEAIAVAVSSANRCQF